MSEITVESVRKSIEFAKMKINRLQEALNEKITYVQAQEDILKELIFKEREKFWKMSQMTVEGNTNLIKSFLEIIETKMYKYEVGNKWCRIIATQLGRKIQIYKIDIPTGNCYLPLGKAIRFNIRTCSLKDWEDNSGLFKITFIS